MAAKKERTFEKALSDLEQVVKTLEKGDLTLDQSLATFEQGVGFARECEAGLSKAKGKVEKLVKNGQGGMDVVPFDPDHE